MPDGSFIQDHLFLSFNRSGSLPWSLLSCLFLKIFWKLHCSSTAFFHFSHLIFQCMMAYTWIHGEVRIYIVFICHAPLNYWLSQTSSLFALERQCCRNIKVFFFFRKRKRPACQIVCVSLGNQAPRMYIHSLPMALAPCVTDGQLRVYMMIHHDSHRSLQHSFTAIYIHPLKCSDFAVHFRKWMKFGAPWYWLVMSLSFYANFSGFSLISVLFACNPIRLYVLFLKISLQLHLSASNTLLHLVLIYLAVVTPRAITPTALSIASCSCPSARQD